MPKKKVNSFSLFGNPKETVKKPTVSKNVANKPKSIKPKNDLLTKPPKTDTKKIATAKPQINTEPTALERWHKTNTNPPTEFRPIEFNTDHKKPVRGFKIVGGYIVNTPYYLNKTNKANGYLEWKYISSCSTLDKCPNGFPDCENCGRRK